MFSKIPNKACRKINTSKIIKNINESHNKGNKKKIIFTDIIIDT